jgi:hypothetical protein
MNQEGPLLAMHDVPVRRVNQDRWALLLLGAVLVLTLAHRMFLLLSTEFPINDGGLFYGFVRQIEPVFPGLPETVTYNGLELPFAYPPLSFWLVTLMSKLGVSPLGIFHVAPILMNLVYVGLFAVVLRRNGASLMFVALAMLFFCSMLRTFEWLVMGGGIPRSLGSLLLLATLLVVGIPDGKNRQPLSTFRMIATGALVAATILTHLEWGINAAVAVIFSRATGSPNLKDFVLGTTIAGLTALVLISPWLYFVYAAHGLEPFLAAGASGQFKNLASSDGVLAILVWGLINPMIPLGVGLMLYRKQFFWPAFFVACLLLTPRHSETPTTMPLAIFAATGAMWLFSTVLQPGKNRAIGWIVMLFFIGVVTIPRFNVDFVAKGAVVHALRRPQLDAMKWVAEYHPKDTFIVLERWGWWSASSAEWFPVLTGARSTNTVQGREWIRGSYGKFYDDDIRLKSAVIRRLSPGVEPRPSCSEIRKRIAVFERPRFLWTEILPECFPASQFRPVYRNSVVTIYELMPGALGQPISGTPTAGSTQK